MLKWLQKKVFNNGNTETIVAIVIFAELLYFVSSFSITANIATVFVGMLDELTNNERVINNLPELKVSPILNQSAQLKAEDMASKGYFAHTSPEGLTPWYWLDLVGYKYNYAGENLAVNFSNTEDVTAAWMNSPTHRANIVKFAYTEVGSGVATGTYKGKEAVFVVQEYANPKPVKIESIEATTSSSTPEIAQINPVKESGEVLGASVEQEEINIPTDTKDFNIKTFLIIIGVSLILFLLSFFLFGAFKTLFRNIFIVIFVVAVVLLFNKIFIKKDLIYTSGVDYVGEEVVE